MFKILLKKLSESLFSVLPVTAIVFILNLTPIVNLTTTEITVFLIASLVLIIGMALFNLGADLAMSPMGEHIGAGLSRSGKIFLLIAVCFSMGLLITVAEPDLSVLAEQVSTVMDGTTLIFAVGLGVGLFLVLAILKIVFHKPLSWMLMFFYMMLFSFSAILAVNGNSGFLAIVFDSGGVTTGPITVPFIMALGVGIAATLGGRNVGENSFGLVAMCSIGPILAVMLCGVFINGELTYTLDEAGYSMETYLGPALIGTAIDKAIEVVKAIGLIIIFFALLQIFFLKLPWKKLKQIIIGIVFTVVGLVVFLTSVTVGFMPVGFKIGTELANENPWIVVAFSFIMGCVVVLAEPAVHVLNSQVEDVTGGSVSKSSMMIALSLGVGISIGLSAIRIIFNFSVLYYLIPGYLISLGLSFFVPGLYTAIAFDSGGVASGPLTSSFILPFAIGVCSVLQPDNIMGDAFGIVAMVAMTPLITIQFLGFRAIVARKVNEKIAMRRILNADDEQIIEFN